MLSSTTGTAKIHLRDKAMENEKMFNPEEIEKAVNEGIVENPLADVSKEEISEAVDKAIVEDNSEAVLRDADRQPAVEAE